MDGLDWILLRKLVLQEHLAVLTNINCGQPFFLVHFLKYKPSLLLKTIALFRMKREHPLLFSNGHKKPQFDKDPPLQVMLCQRKAKS